MSRCSFPVVLDGRAWLEWVDYSIRPAANTTYRKQGKAYIDVKASPVVDTLPFGFYTFSREIVGESCELAMYLAAIGFDGWCASGDLDGSNLCAIGSWDLKRTVMTVPYILVTPYGIERVE